MTGYQRSNDSRKHVKIKTKVKRPAPMVNGLMYGVLD